jgi:predicted transcriptional regulator
MTAPSEIKFRFSPLSSKSKKVLGPLECEIMDVVWGQGRTTVSAVHKALRDKKDLAYTTVMTTMSRLAKKNLLHQDTTSSTYVYTPALSREEFDRYVVKGVIRGLIDDYGDVVGECFVECLNESDGAVDKARVSAALCK